MRLHWSQSIPAPLRGLILARERETILAWDAQDRLFLFNHAGKIQAQRPASVPIASASCAEDGSAYAVGGSQTPLLCWLAPDLSPRWQRTLPERATAVAVEPLGRAVSVADAGCTLHLMDARGRTLWTATTPRPLHHLAFISEKQVLVGAADFGLIVCFGASGECLWRDGLVAHVGSLAVNGDGSCILLACFTDGLYRYNAAGPQQQRIALESPCRFAALSYAGDHMLTADSPQRLCLRNRTGDIRKQMNLDGPIAGVALNALADSAVVGLANGTVLRFDEAAADAEAGGNLLK